MFRTGDFKSVFLKGIEGNKDPVWLEEEECYFQEELYDPEELLKTCPWKEFAGFLRDVEERKRTVKKSIKKI